MSALRFGRFVVPSVAFAMASFALTPAAEARSRLLDDDVEVFAQQAVDSGDGGPTTRRQDDRRRANDADWFRAPVQQVGPEDFPSNELHDAVEANTRAATARAMYRRAESALNATARAARRDFEQSAELREAQAAEQRAYDSLLAARREALKEVVEDPKYQAMQDLRDNLSQRIADRREGLAAYASPRLVSTTMLPAPRDSREDDVIAIASVRLRVGSDARAMERDALDGNDKIRRAKEDLASASAKVADLRVKFDRSLRDNEDLKQARDELEEARIARLTTSTYLDGAREAAREALDFAYYVHRYDYYRYRPYGYGFDVSPYRFGYPYYGVNYMNGRR